jgi:SAM-dependent methyltransferase
LLARAAASVVGIDIDERAIHHARAKYSAGHLHFVAGSITEIPLCARFDLIVCLEVLEHIDEHDRLLCEVKRLLTPDGVLVISTPNKNEYRKLEPSNPFHVKELNYDEFKTLLTRFFSQTKFLGQRMHCGSGLSAPDRHPLNAVAPLIVDRASGEFILSGTDPRPPVYFIGMASDAEIPADSAGGVLMDGSDSYFGEMARIQRELAETISSQKEALAWREEQGREFEATIHSHEQALAWRALQVENLHDEMRHQQMHIEMLVTRNEDLAAQNEALAAQNEALAAQNDALAARVRTVETSRTWLLAQKFFRLRDRVFPLKSLRRKIYDRLVSKVKL